MSLATMSFKLSNMTSYTKNSESTMSFELSNMTLYTENPKLNRYPESMRYPELTEKILEIFNNNNKQVDELNVLGDKSDAGSSAVGNP